MKTFISTMLVTSLMFPVAAFASMATSTRATTQSGGYAYCDLAGNISGENFHCVDRATGQVVSTNSAPSQLESLMRKLVALLQEEIALVTKGNH